MANKGKIDEFFDLEKFARDKKTVLDGIAEVVGKIQSAGMGVKGSQSLTEQESAQVRLNAAIKESENLLKKEAIQNQKKLDDAEKYKQKQIDQQIKKENAERDKSARALQKEADYLTKHGELYVKLTREVEALLVQTRELTLAKGKENAATIESQKQYDAARKKLTDLNQVMGNHRDDVGRYGKALEGLKSGWASLMVVWGAVAVVGSEVLGFFKESIQLALDEERAEARLKFALNGSADATERMLRFRKQLTGSTLFEKDDIQSAITMGLELGRTEAEVRKMVETAMGLSRVTGKDLNSMMLALSATYEGQTGRLGRLAGEVKGLTAEQLKNGDAVDILNKKYSQFAHEGLGTTEGEVIQARKWWKEFSEEIGVKTIIVLRGIAAGFQAATAVMGGGVSPQGKYNATMGGLFNAHQQKMDEIAAEIEANKKRLLTNESVNESTDKSKDKTVKETDAIQKLEEQVSKLTFTLNNQIAAGSADAQITAKRISLLQDLITRYKEYKDVLINGISPMQPKPSGRVTINPTAPQAVPNPTPDFTQEPQGTEVKSVVDAERKQWERRLETTRQFVSQIQGIVNQLYEGQLNQIDAEKQAVDDRYQAEYDAAEGNSKKQKEIKKRQAKEDAELDKQKRKVMHDQAVLQKALGAVQIIINTAVGAMAQYEAGPGGFVLSALVIALGAIELAATLAAPIPALAKGRKGGPATFARVSEEGQEAMIYKGKEYLLPEKESLAYIPAGASVIPHNELMNAAGVSTMTPLPKYNYAGILGLSREEAIMLNRELVKTIKNKRETHITFDRHGFSAAAHEGANWEYYLNNRIRL